MTFGFFPYSPLYYKGAQEYLDKKAARGLALQKVYLGCIARFEKAEGPHHFVDLESAQDTYDDPMRTYKDYLQLCDDAGWELIQELRGMFLFRSKPGTHPLPIQTDGEMEWERFWEKNKPRLRNTVVMLLSIALLLFVLMVIPSSGAKITPTLMNNTSLLLVLYYGISLFFSFLAFGCSKAYLARCKKAEQVEPPSRFGIFLDSFDYIRVIAGFCLILLLFTSLFHPARLHLGTSPFQDSENTATPEICQQYPVLMAQDLGLPDGSSRYLTGRSSLLGQFYDYSEISSTGEPNGPIYILTTERYDCAFESLAKLVFDLRARETRNYFTWGKLDWEETHSLDFEESYTCQNGAYLLLRQGKVVALVGCSGIDLTTPENLQIIRARLDLPPV